MKSQFGAYQSYHKQEHNDETGAYNDCKWEQIAAERKIILYSYVITTEIVNILITIEFRNFCACFDEA